MDASDGLFDVLREFSAPGVRATIDLRNIPYHPFAREYAERLGIRASQLIFGEIGEGRGVWALDVDGRIREVRGPINEHFRSRIEDASGFMQQIRNGKFFW